MLVAHIFDLVPIGVLLVGTVAVLLLFIEIGYQLGRRDQLTATKAQTSQVRAIMGAGLGLLAFMLAFTFSTAQSHFEARTQSLAEEARIARGAFMQADLLAQPNRSQAKQLLRDYIQVRSGVRKISRHDARERMAALLQSSELIQKKLWALASQGDGQIPRNQMQAEQGRLFKVSVLALTDIHYARLHAAVMNRIPVTIWFTLYLMAALAMIIMGYQAGLTGKRSPFATITLAIAFSAVIILITDLDRPIMSFFEINDQLLVDLSEYMDVEMRLEDLLAE